jgi:hypothetical protein
MEGGAVWRWLASRGLAPEDILALELLRERPLSLTPGLSGWPPAPWIAMLPLYDPTGLQRSFMARSTEKGSKPKSRPPAGYQRAGLCLADPLALAILQAPPGQPPAPWQGATWNGYVVIVEGDPDYLTISTLRGRAIGGRSYAVFGWIGSSGLELELCQRMPEGSRVIVFSQRDAAGGGAASATLERLARVGKGLELFRLEMASLEGAAGLEAGAGGKDLNDLLQRRALPDTLEGLLSCALPWSEEAPEAPDQEEPIQEDILPEEPLAGLPWLTGAGLWPKDRPAPPPWLLLEPASSALEKGSGVLPLGKVGLLAAPGGTGKSWILAALALAVATGRGWLAGAGHGGEDGPPGWLDVRQRGRVLLIGGEDGPGDLPRRIYDQARALQIPEEERLEAMERLTALPGASIPLQLLQAGAKKDSLEHTPFLTGLIKRLQNSPPLSLIILDPLARFSPAEGETDSHAATKLINALELLTQLPGSPVVLAAHHTRKGAAGMYQGSLEASDIRGSSALVDGARFAAALESQELPYGQSDRPWPGLERLIGLARISVVKINDGRKPKPFIVGRVGTGGLTGLYPRELEALDRAQETREQDRAAITIAAKEARKEARKGGKGVPS